MKEGVVVNGSVVILDAEFVREMEGERGKGGVGWAPTISCWRSGAGDAGVMVVIGIVVVVFPLMVVVVVGMGIGAEAGMYGL